MDCISGRREEEWVVVAEGAARSEAWNPYPTTFVQADTSSFKQVVQMLTGSSVTAKQPSNTNPIPPKFKLYQRRTNNSFKNNITINPLSSSPPRPDFPALVLSPVTPLIRDPFQAQAQAQAQDKDKGFFFQPSPTSTPRDPHPRLLPLFPTSSAPSSSSS